MGFLSDLAGGIVEGLIAGNSSYEERGRIDRLCRELGWAIDERDRQGIRLHFKDPLAGIRKVFISSGDEALALICVYSYAVLPQNQVPAEIASHLLMRNSELAIGAWQAAIDRDGGVLFTLRYVASGPGLTAALLKFTCEKLVNEAIGFDERMSQAGLLRS